MALMYDPGYHLPPAVDGKQINKAIGPAEDSIEEEKTQGIILHEYIQKLGETTNILVFSHVDNNKGVKFTREEIRQAIEKHVNTLKDGDRDMQHIARIQTGKAAVNYWIDRLVENGSFSKQHSKPVLFWR